MWFNRGIPHLPSEIVEPLRKVGWLCDIKFSETEREIKLLAYPGIKVEVKEEWISSSKCPVVSWGLPSRKSSPACSLYSGERQKRKA